MDYLAKSSGFTLEEHTNNVINQGKIIIKTYPFVVEKYKQMVGKDFDNRLLAACKYHDIGKKHSQWQGAVRADFQVFLDWKKENNGDFDAFAKAVGNTGLNLMKANIRHEIVSVIRCPNLPLPILVAIGAHHKKLSNRDNHKNKWVDNVHLKEKGQDVWNKFEKLSLKFTLKPIPLFRNALKSHFEYAGIRGHLQLADHRASIAENNAFIPDFIPFSYTFPEGWTKRPVQQIAEESWQDDLLLIRAPTGAGKTAASLLWANKQIQNRRADRLIIAMPTRFTSNALSIDITDSLSNTGLYHSSAWFKKFHKKTKGNKEAKHKYGLIHEFARRLQTPVTVSTIDHLLISLTLSREDHHAIAFNLANSCVVIDEADFYDDFTQANIIVLLEALNEWKVPVMIMSASLPKSSLSMYQTTGYDVTKIHEDRSDLIRPRCKIKTIKNYEYINELKGFLEQATMQPTIIYANTVGRSVELYEWFIQNTDITPMLYHSRFTEPDKLKKEAILLKNLGKDAWNNNTANGVAILTQIGEMSINISADVMLSEVCPIDRLVQRAGRLCRFDTNKVGELHVFVPHKTYNNKKNIYPAPYGSYEKRKWKVAPALQKTINLLQLKQYSAQDFVNLINIVYEKLEDFSLRAKNNAQELKKSFAFNWIILPKAQSETDDSETNNWKSRDIDSNETVLTHFPENPYFNNYLNWQSFKIENSVDLPVYLIDQGIKLFKIYQSEIYLKGEKQPVYRTYEGVYNQETGLFFSKEKEINDNFL